jgi:transposase
MAMMLRNGAGKNALMMVLPLSTESQLNSLLAMKFNSVIVTTATPLICAVGDGKLFKRGRDMAAWLGLTPKQLYTL